MSLNYPKGRSWHQKVIKIITGCTSNRKNRKGGAKQSTTNVSYGTQIAKTRLLALRDTRVNFLQLTELNHTESLRQVKVYQPIDDDKCD